MQAIILDDKDPNGISLSNVELPALGADEVRIKIIAAALNHRDEWCRAGKYANISQGVILGSDGAGIIEEVGNEVDSSWLNKEVIINPAIDWGNDQRAQSRDFRILGMPDHGTFAEYIHVKANRTCLKPQHLTWEEAAALPLAGLTAFRAVDYHGQIKSGDKVLITGFGGGVAQFAAQFAIAKSAEVYISSSSERKIGKAVSMGAIGGFNYNSREWVKKAKEEVGGFDVVIDSAMGDTLSDLLDVVHPGGKIIFFGATLGNPSSLNARKVFWSQISLQGTTMGSDTDFGKMMDFINKQEIKPIIDSIRPLGEALAAFEKMKAGDQMGKLVLAVS